ncbi:MAG: sensor histidine kinase [Planctomycetaceae bacterium]|jgi:signal transduction histidine kinase|nr:sensor histidine kinase [Planctomycetaceae bacterium]
MSDNLTNNCRLEIVDSIEQDRSTDSVENKESTQTAESERIDELNRRIEILSERLSQSQRLSAIGELTSTTVHEFNNILTTIINYAKLGMRHVDKTSQKNAFEKILTVANRAAKVATTILAAAKNRKQSLEPTNLITLVDDVMLLLGRELNKYKIVIERYFPQNAPEIMADGNQIQQVLINLLVNARQAMKNGGRLILKIIHDEENEMLDLTIRDYGCGIDENELPHIFDRFYSTKSGPDETGKGGTGLGLAACKEIIEQHKGVIRVESKLGKGTAFTLKLPTVIRAKLIELQQEKEN